MCGSCWDAARSTSSRCPARAACKSSMSPTFYYVEICDHDLLFHTKQGEVHSTGSMRDVEQKLPPENFFRSSKAYLVNLEHVDGIQDEDAIVNGERVQISRAKRKAFLAALNHYMGETI